MKTNVYIATSLDGFIAKKDGNLDWLNEIPNPDGSDFGFSEFLSTIDAIVMGKNTYEKILTFPEWPYIKPVFVLSNTIKTLPESLTKKAELMSGNPGEILINLKKMNFQSVYIDGGLTINEFLKEDLIDILIITRIPVVLGNGIPLFSSLHNELQFEHVDTIVYNSSLVKSCYKRKRT
jgi:dihydrofolate reductase